MPGLNDERRLTSIGACSLSDKDGLVNFADLNQKQREQGCKAPSLEALKR
jgi:hypothetical protein